MKKNVQCAAVAAVDCVSPLTATAADFDGSKPLFCGAVDAHACDPGITCDRSLPSESGAPQFLRLDFAKKTVTSHARATPILFIDKGGSQILLRCAELGFARTIALDGTDGAMSVAPVSRDDVFVLFGACTPEQLRRVIP
ncbi:hypothetical protein [Paraburkholderia sp. Cpub6]|uniref:hypothetical protein n=1 Tax=Paraburkholderia sp. Cpub6 TaxID=2723094 RepID=UPI00161FF74B|nr:hypothetical protein [Paraburkholderia sp. Cpub6]MBB5460278.1 hypothetical protein [Paraburkholderia sp. Cpub6]